MLPSLLAGCAILLIGFQLWWTLAYIYAYGQVRAIVLMIQVVQGMTYVLFFALIVWGVFGGQTVNRLVAPALLTTVVITILLWRVFNGPALLVRSYPRRWRDVLLFRRPSVDLKRRVRGK